MKHLKQLTTVTPFSKYLALFLFISLPFVGFYLGIHYQKGISMLPTISSSTTTNTNWKTYTSSDYSFKYPIDGGWKASEGTQPAGNFVSLSCSSSCEVANYIGFSIDQWTYTSLNEFRSKEDSQYKLFTQVEDASIDEKPAIKGIIPGVAGGGYYCTQLIYYVVHNGKGYRIMYEIPKLNLRTFSQLPTPEPDILSTLRFND